MQIPPYVIYELLIRMQELNPDIGSYISNKRTDEGILVRTTAGHIVISDLILSKQFLDPASISIRKIRSLLDGFKEIV